MKREASDNFFDPKPDAWRTDDATIRPRHTFEASLGEGMYDPTKVFLRIDNVEEPEDGNPDSYLVRNSLVHPAKEYGEEEVIIHRWFSKIRRGQKITVGEEAVVEADEHKLSPKARIALGLVVTLGGIVVTKELRSHYKNKKS